MAPRRKKRISFRFYVLIAVALAVFGYGAYSVVGDMIQRTAVIQSGGASTQHTADAVILRKETLTDAEGLTSVKYFADEGELLQKGSKIAEIFQSGYNKSDENSLRRVREQIRTQLKVKLSAEYGDQTLKRMDTQISEYAHALELMVHGNQSGNLLNIERQLQTALSARHSYLRTKFSGDQTLTGLYNEESTLIKNIEIWTNTRLAESECLVSFYTDEYETMLSADSFETITATQVRNVLAGLPPEKTAVQRGRTPVLREVRPNGWYLLLLSNDPNWKPAEGQTYKVKLSGLEAVVFDGTVVSSSRLGSELLVRMTVAGSVRPVLNLRKARAEVGEDYVAGLKVPIRALYRQGGQLGIVRTDNGGVFVPIDIVSQDNEFAIITPRTAGALWEGQKIKVF